MYLQSTVMNVFVESGSWFESGSGMICATCKTFRCASAAADGEPPPFMFRPVKDEDNAAVSDVLTLLFILLFINTCI